MLHKLHEQKRAFSNVYKLRKQLQPLLCAVSQFVSAVFLLYRVLTLLQAFNDSRAAAQSYSACF